MKKMLCIAIAAVICVSALLVGCTGPVDKTPDEYSGIRWISSDYSMRFTPDDDCKGTYKYNDKKYNVRFEFDSTSVTVYDTDNDDARLFYGSWMYEDDDKLYIYDVSFDKDNYKEMKNNLMGFITLKQEKLEKEKKK